MQKTNFPCRLIVGEDFSTDKTRAICEQYALEYPDKITLLPSDENYGMMPNFIRTLKACTDKYIALCEGDDYWADPLKPQKQVDFLEENEEYSLCFHDTKIVDSKNNIISDSKIKKMI
jgi:glycosyltransferase involved in cell wall biosynthesis